MGKKKKSIRVCLKILTILEYDAVLENYPEGERTAEDICRIDRQSAVEDPSIFMDNDDAVTRVRCEVVE